MTSILKSEIRTESNDSTTSSHFKTEEIVVGVFILLVTIEGVLFFLYCSIQLWKGDWVWPGWNNENRVVTESIDRNSLTDSEIEA